MNTYVIAVVVIAAIAIAAVYLYFTRGRYVAKRFDHNFHQDMRRHELHNLVRVASAEPDTRVRFEHVQVNGALAMVETLKSSGVPIEAHVHIFVGGNSHDGGSTASSLLPIVEMMRETGAKKSAVISEHDSESPSGMKALPPPTHH